MSRPTPDSTNQQSKGTAMRSSMNILAAVSLSLLLGACADGTGPLPTGDSVGVLPSGVMSAAKGGNRKVSPTDGSTTTPTDTAGTNVPSPLPWLATAPLLETYDTTFMVVQGESSWNGIYFQGNGNKKGHLFLELNIPAEAQFVDSAGLRLPAQSTVPLSVHVDRQSLAISFGPHGSSFSKSAYVVIHFENNLLKTGSDASALLMYYQPDADAPWSVIPSTIELKSKKIMLSLYHFSNYAVAY